MVAQIETDEEKLVRYRNWASRIVTALENPETVSAYGGMPDISGSGPSIGRMPGRAELLNELQWLNERIDELTSLLEDGPYLGTTLGVT